MNGNQKKDMIIVIPGPKFIKGFNQQSERIIKKFYDMTKIREPIYYNYAKVWSDRITNNNREAVWLHWGRGIGPISKWFAVKRLNKLINHYKNTHNVKIIGISIGAEIALESLKGFDKGEVSNAVFLCPVLQNPRITLKNVKISGFYSPDDLFARISAKVLAPVHGGVRLLGSNVRNIEVKGFSHDEFCADKKIKSGKDKGKRLTSVVSSLLD